jgi:hypothetical protein
MECRKGGGGRQVAKEKRWIRFAYIFVTFGAVIF